MTHRILTALVHLLKDDFLLSFIYSVFGDLVTLMQHFPSHDLPSAPHLSQPAGVKDKPNAAHLQSKLSVTGGALLRHRTGAQGEDKHSSDPCGAAHKT